MGKPLPDAGLDQIFRLARTRRSWSEEETPEILIRAVYDLQKFAPTSGNCCPGRFLFIRSVEAKKRLDPLMDAGNREQTFSAPWTCIVAYDLGFPNFMGKLAPHLKNPKAGLSDPAVVEWLAIQNGSLGGAYMMIAARALGLDCGPMNGFNREGINKEFFLSDPKMQTWRVNFVCNLGHGDNAQLFARAPRLDFDEACAIL